MYRTKTIPVFLFLLTLALSILATSVSASRFYSRNRYSVTAADTINDDIYLAASEGVFSGVVNGDIIIACRDYSIDGEVLGSVNSVSQTVTIKGTVGNSVRVIGETIIIYGNINSNLLAFGRDIEIGEGCRIGKDATIFGEEVSFSGEIGHDLKVEAEQIVISGRIDGDLSVEAGKISIIAPAEITGDIDYKSKRELRIEDDVIVGGEINWNRIEADDKKSGDAGIGWVLRIMLFMASLVTGLFIIGFTNRHARVASDQVIHKPLVSLGVGFVAFCIAPIAILVLMALIISIPVALILLFAYTIFFYIAKIYVAIAIGRIGIRAFRKNVEPRQGWSLFFGLIILTILFGIPVLGWIIYFAVIFWGIGAILLGLQACRVSAVANKLESTDSNPPPVT